MLVGLRPGDRVVCPEVTYALVDETGALSLGSAPGDAVATEHELLDQPELRAHLVQVLGGTLDVYAHAPGLVAVCRDAPWGERPNRVGRQVLRGLEADLCGTALLRELYGPLVLLAAEAGEDVTSPLGPEQEVRIWAEWGRAVAFSPWTHGPGW